MKKILTLAVAIAATAIVNGATVTWSANTAAMTDVTSGYFAVLVDASSYDSLDKAVSSLMADGASAAGVMTSGAGVYNSANNLVVAALANKTLPSGYEAGQTVNYWTLIFDGSIGEGATAKNYVNTAATAEDAAAAGTAVISAAGKLAISQGAVTSAEWTQTTASIPEPTSGLLLLLGVAGLALRRRRA